MKLQIAFTLLAIAAPAALIAQAPAPAVDTKNPIVWSANDVYARQAKYIVAAAEEMPADKYSYKPTPEQMTFGKTVAHVVQSNFGICSMLSGTPATAPKVAETDPKDTLIVALKASFESCDKAMAGLQDSQLSETITFFRGAKVPRARALIEITGDLEDHYSQMAAYLRLNGMTPPSAAPKK
jgi:uncharacterized damage-inducible protein DinB